MKRLTVAALAVAALAGGSFQAEACNPMANKNFGKIVAPSVIPAAMLARNHPETPAKTSVVGLWHDVRTASDGTLFMEGYDTWANDGTEYELGNFPPITGALCVGVWTQHGKTIDLVTHVAWLYDMNSNYIGTLNITQSMKVAKDGNSYTGPFDAKFYDPTGTLFQEVTGTSVGDRLGG